MSGKFNHAEYKEVDGPPFDYTVVYYFHCKAKHSGMPLPLGGNKMDYCPFCGLKIDTQRHRIEKFTGHTPPRRKKVTLTGHVYE